MGALILIDDDAPVDVQFIETTAADDDGNSTASLAANWGAVVSGRLTIVAVHHASTSASARTLTAATIGGVAATALALPATLDELGIDIIGALDVPGTSGTIGLTFSGGVGVRCAVWRATNVSDITPIDSAEDSWGFDSSDHTVTVDVEQDGALFAAVMCQYSGTNPDFTAGVVDDYSEEIVPTSPIKIMGGFGLTPATVVNQAVTASHNGGSTWRGAMTAFSLR